MVKSFGATSSVLDVAKVEMEVVDEEGDCSFDESDEGDGSRVEDSDVERVGRAGAGMVSDSKGGSGELSVFSL